MKQSKTKKTNNRKTALMLEFPKRMYNECFSGGENKSVYVMLNNCKKGKRLVNNKFWQFVEQEKFNSTYQNAEQGGFKIAKIHRFKYANMNKNYSKLNKINYSRMNIKYVWR